MTATAERIERVLATLDAEPVLLGHDWVAALDERKREEAGFHDADRAGHRDERATSTPNRRYYEAAGPVRELVDEWLRRESRGAICLDYACGNGHASRTMAAAGAALVVGIDISEVSVANAVERASQAGYGSISRYLQRDCEDTGLPAGAFDVVLCSGMLHHLDLKRAFPELHRVLAPGGRIMCMEALAYNPLIQLYRRLTPELRTEFETKHILSLRDVKFAERWFRVESLAYHLMAAPLATLLPAGLLRRSGLAIGHAVDAILTRVPLLQRWAWIFTFQLVKPS